MLAMSKCFIASKDPDPAGRVQVTDELVVQVVVPHKDMPTTEVGVESCGEKFVPNTVSVI